MALPGYHVQNNQLIPEYFVVSLYYWVNVFHPLLWSFRHHWMIVSRWIHFLVVLYRLGLYLIPWGVLLVKARLWLYTRPLWFRAWIPHRLHELQSLSEWLLVTCFAPLCDSQFHSPAPTWQIYYTWTLQLYSSILTRDFWKKFDGEFFINVQNKRVEPRFILSWNCLTAAMVTMVPLGMSDSRMSHSLEPTLFKGSVEPIRKAFVMASLFYIKMVNWLINPTKRTFI